MVEETEVVVDSVEVAEAGIQGSVVVAAEAEILEEVVVVEAAAAEISEEVEVVVVEILEEVVETSEVEEVEVEISEEVEVEVDLENREGTWPLSYIFPSNLI